MDINGNFDTTEEETKIIRTKLREVQFDEYDKLIQLCDAISGAEGVMNIVDRMNDVKMRYGAYDINKWNTNLALKDYFEQTTSSLSTNCLNFQGFVLCQP